MRMHRGSSKGRRGLPPGPEDLPLSASPSVQVTLRCARAGREELRTIRIPRGSTVRDALRSAGLFAEGSAALLGERSIPLDTPIDSNCEIVVVPTFSGG